jgi:hypothetical protein
MMMVIRNCQIIARNMAEMNNSSSSKKALLKLSCFMESPAEPGAAACPHLRVMIGDCPYSVKLDGSVACAPC